MGPIDQTATPSELIGGRYEREILLGRGGAGEVWRARHVALNSHVAIKFLHHASAENESTRSRFLKEAQVTAQLKTRYAVQVFDYGFTDSGQPYLVMELLDGETIGRRLERQGRLPPALAVAFLTQVARALERAHAIGIVHRDLKPDNLIVVADEEGRECIKVLDFGIAKLLGDLDTVTTDDADPTLLASRAMNSFTRTGAFLGTPYYMAPEQVRNSSDVDLRADVWAFGVVAYQCLTGKQPFNGKNLMELFGRIQRGEHPSALSECPELPRAFDMWFDIACSLDREKRFPSARAAADRLALAIDPEGSTSVDSFSSRDPIPPHTPRDRAIIIDMGAATTLPDNTPPPPPATTPVEKRRFPRRSALAVLAVMLVAGLASLSVRRAAGTGAASVVNTLAVPAAAPTSSTAPPAVPIAPASASGGATSDPSAPPLEPPREAPSSRRSGAPRSGAPSVPRASSAMPSTAPAATTSAPSAEAPAAAGGGPGEHQAPRPKPAASSPFELPPLGI